MTKLELRGEITNYKCEKSNQEFQSSRSCRGAFYFQNNEPSWYNTVNGSDPNTGSSLTFGLLGFAQQEGEGREGASVPGGGCSSRAKGSLNEDPAKGGGAGAGESSPAGKKGPRDGKGTRGQRGQEKGSSEEEAPGVGATTMNVFVRMATPARNWLDPLFFFWKPIFFKSRSTLSSLPLRAHAFSFFS